MNNRRSVRAEWCDYNAGLYFVTICTNNRQKYFGDIVNREMHLSDIGKIVNNAINDIRQYQNDVEILQYVVMPNHIHLMVSIEKYPEHDSAQANGCLRPPGHDVTPCDDYHYNSRLSLVIRMFKARCTRAVCKNIWQRNYYESVITTKARYDYAVNYIAMNVYNWLHDDMYT
jgi:REP element-mobilizing transposase RayT